MNKIPVGRTIAYAYNFTFGEIGTVIGLIWIPALINSVAGFFALSTYETIVASGAPPAAVAPSAGLFLLYICLGAVLAAVMAAAVTRQAIGLRQGPAIAHFSLGAVELRVLAGIVSLFLLFVVFAIGLELALGAIAAVAAALAGSNPAMAAIVPGLALGALLLLAYIVIRLSFLFAPAAVSDSTIGIVRSWELTRGNFWRILLIGIATLAPVALLFFALQYAILGPQYVAAEVVVLQDPANSKHTADLARLLLPKLPLLLGLNFVGTPISYGLLFAPAAYAYRVLTGKPGAVSDRTA